MWDLPEETQGAQATAAVISVVVADDSYLVREALHRVLAADEMIDVVAACHDRDSLERAIEREHPDVVVTDIRMPPTYTDEGLQVASALREEYPCTGVVILSQYAEPRYSLALLDGGSDRRAYLLKERIQYGSQLVTAIRNVAEGGSMIDAKVVETLMNERRRVERSKLADLTSRELEILGYVARGGSNQAIAAELFVTKRAVEKHIHAIFVKLDLPDAANADVSRRVKAALIYLSDPAAN